MKFPKQRSREKLHFAKRTLPAWLFDESAAGIVLSGDSGSGKSNALEIILERLIRYPDAGLLFIDPHGTSARKVRRFALAQGRSASRRTLYLQPSSIADAAKLFSINPLFVPGDPGTLRWQARLTVIVETVAKILLASWGESDFNSKPILFKNVFRILTTLAHSGLSLADARLFLDLRSPIYQTIVQACPDLIARLEMEELPELRAAERLAQIESAKNRFLGFLSNPIVEALFSRVDNALHFQELYDQRSIVIVNLELGGVLRTMDQQILANLFLTLMLFTILNTSGSERYPYYIAIDELPVFSASFDLIQWMIGQTRKFMARFLFCFQGTGLFPERTDDRLLHAINSQCRTHFFFRHGSPVDAEFFGKYLVLPTYSSTKIKYVHRQPMQFQEGHDLVVLTDEAAGTSNTTGTSNSSSTSQTRGSGTSEGSNDSASQTFRDTVELARAEARGRTRGNSTSSSSATQNGSSSSSSSSQSSSTTRKQQLVPIIRTHQIVTSVQFKNKEEQEMEAASSLTQLGTGQACLYVTGQSAIRVQFPLSNDPFQRTPRFALSMEAKHQLIQEQRPAFATLSTIQSEHQAMIDALVRQLCFLIDQGIPAWQSPLPVKQAELLATAIENNAPSVDSTEATGF